jgi:hypothetical protein
MTFGRKKKLKKTILPFLLLVVFAKTSWSQNTNLNYHSGIKLYNTTIFEEQSKSMLVSDTSSVRFQYTNTNSQILHPTIAFQWKSKTNNFHEIELTNFMVNKVGTKTEYVSDTSASGLLISGQDIVTTAISVRYEYILTFNKSKDNKFVPSLGLGVNPYFRKNKYSPLASSSFPASEGSLGLRTFITPRITYFITPKIFVDFNIPLCLFDNFIKTEITENANLPVESRSVSSFNFTSFPQFLSARIGIGIKL